MTARRWIHFGVLVALGLSYIAFFTEWLRPAPIEIASQVRFTIQPPRFGRPVKKTDQPPQPGKGGRSGQPAQGNQPARPEPFERIGLPDKGVLDQAPGGVANVTFSLDGWYNLTK